MSLPGRPTCPHPPLPSQTCSLPSLMCCCLSPFCLVFICPPDYSVYVCLSVFLVCLIPLYLLAVYFCLPVCLYIACLLVCICLFISLSLLSCFSFPPPFLASLPLPCFISFPLLLFIFTTFPQHPIFIFLLCFMPFHYPSMAPLLCFITFYPFLFLFRQDYRGEEDSHFPFPSPHTDCFTTTPNRPITLPLHTSEPEHPCKNRTKASATLKHFTTGFFFQEVSLYALKKDGSFALLLS